MKENVEYQYNIKFTGLNRTNGKGNPAHQLHSVMQSFLDVLSDAEVIDDYQSEIFILTRRIEDGQEVIVLH